jgi:hypothetical protein
LLEFYVYRSVGKIRPRSDSVRPMPGLRRLPVQTHSERHSRNVTVLSRQMPSTNGRSWMIRVRTSKHLRLAARTRNRRPSRDCGRRGRDGYQDALLETFSIITTDPNELMQPMHTRMPAIVPRADWSRWLGHADPDQPPVDLLRPHVVEEMTAWKVGRNVGNVKYNSPELLEHVNPALRRQVHCSVDSPLYMRISTQLRI